MNTPRSGLVRATEGAIKEYIKDGCVENLPLIRQLEDVAFQIWVESNTSFLNETVETLEDDDGWIWDEGYLFQSFSAHADDNLVNAIEDFNSSICSSIKPCDESDCSFGYLASCEDTELLEFSGIESWDLSESDFSDVDVTDKSHCSLPYNPQNEIAREKSCMTRSNKRGIVNRMDTITSNDKANDGNWDPCVTKLETTINEDEWVVVNYDVSECDPNNEWFIVSVNETCKTTSDTMRMKEADPIDIYPDNHENQDKRLTDDRLNIDGVINLNDWAVLSMKITERKNFSNELEIRKEDMTVLSSSTGWSDVKATSKVKGQCSCDKPNVDRCPLCRNSVRKNDYKCAIFCLLLK